MISIPNTCKAARFDLSYQTMNMSPLTSLQHIVPFTAAESQLPCHGDDSNNVFSLFELMLNVSVNSYGHVGMLPPFYGTCT